MFAKMINETLSLQEIDSSLCKLHKPMAKNTIIVKDYRSPLGVLTLGDYDGLLCLCDWKYRAKRDLIDRRVLDGLDACYKDGESPLLSAAIKQLEDYLSGSRKGFTLPLLTVGSAFQKKVWDELLKIPYGSTISYYELSERLGDPLAIRAVSVANGSNALSIFIPCHRVIGSDGDLTGYAGGIPAKHKLLKLEGGLPGQDQLELFS